MGSFVAATVIYSALWVIALATFLIIAPWTYERNEPPVLDVALATCLPVGVTLALGEFLINRFAARPECGGAVARPRGAGARRGPAGGAA